MLATEKGDNWSVTVFLCPIDRLIEVLPALWDVLEQNNKITLIPHYTIRGSFPKQKIAIISWRVLRKNESTSRVDEIIRSKLIEYQIAPLKGEQFIKYHNWFLEGEVNEIWNRKSCELLHQLSDTAILIMKNGLFQDSSPVCSRGHTLHLLANMLGLQENPELVKDKIIIWDDFLFL